MQLLHIISRPQSREIIGYLLKNGAATSLELEMSLSIPQYGVSRELRSLKVLDVIKVTGVVRRPYVQEGRGPKVKIFALVDATPEQVIDAQRRYAELTLSEPVEDRGAETVIDMYAEQALRAVTEAGLTGERMGPVYDVVNGLSIPVDVAPGVKRRVNEILTNRLAEGRFREMEARA
jgi:predicted ArsR family transcriptional regulator